MNEHRLLDRLARGDLRNVRFTELCRLVKALGFEQRRISGSHYIFSHPAFPEILTPAAGAWAGETLPSPSVPATGRAIQSVPWRVISERLPHQRLLQRGRQRIHR
ncbi:MAG: type II toxin-antitoxin system HicA family toxin [Pseudonocardiaceae bacterium]